MDITKFYELRKRLYACAASGTATVSEDFRLKRAVDEFGAEMASSKPMMKLYALCEELFTAANSADKLAECIALADALAVVQGGFADCSETKKSTVRFSDTNGSQFTYSEITGAVSKLSAMNLQLFYDSDAKKELYMDNRVLAAFFKMLDRTELPPISFIFTENYGKRLIPILKNNMPGFSDKAKVNSIRLIGKVAGAEENELYVSLAADGEQSADVRSEAVLAMKYSPENAERLMEIYHTEKGKIKSAALMALGRFDIPEMAEIWEKLLESNKSTDLRFLTASCSHIITEYVRKEIFGAIDDFRNSSNNEQSRRLFKLRDMLRFTYDCEDILILLIRQGLLVNDIMELLIDNIREYPGDEGYRRLVERVFVQSEETMPAWLLMNMTSDGKCFSDVDNLMVSDMFIPLVHISENIRYCGAVEKYIMPLSYLYPRGGNWVTVDDEIIKKIAVLMSDMECIAAYANIDKNPIERMKAVRAVGGEDNLHLGHVKIMSMANSCCRVLEKIDVKKAAEMSIITAMYCPAIDSVGVLVRKNILTPENSQGILERFMLFISKHFTLKRANNFSKFHEAEQILRLVPMTDEQKLAELISLKKKLRMPMLAADTAMLEESRKFTDKLILQFQNKLKGD